MRVLILGFIDWLVGDALNKAWRCEECRKIRKLYRCKRRHRIAEENGRCRSMFCARCNNDEAN